MRLPVELIEELPDGSILKSLANEEVAEILSFAATRKLAKGEVLVSHGDPSDSMMIVLRGLLKACLVTAAGREVVLDHVGVGGFIGELGVFDGAPRSASVIALEPSTVLVFQRRMLIPYFEKNGRAALKVVALLCARLRRTNALVEDTSALPLGPRLARGLLRLVEAHGADLRLSQTDIAGYVGLARENVNRQLKDWEKAGLLALGRGRVNLRDCEALAEIAEALD